MEYMKTVTSLIDEFYPMLKELKGEDTNVVIGGTCAILMHGLDIGRDPEDLDVIIYKPTDRQKKVLNVLKPLSQVKYYCKDLRTMHPIR